MSSKYRSRPYWLYSVINDCWECVDGDLLHRANPSAMVSKLDEDIGGSGAYRPPKLAAVAMDVPSGAVQVDSDEELLAQAAGITTTHSMELSGTCLTSCVMCIHACCLDQFLFAQGCDIRVQQQQKHGVVACW